MNYIVPDLTKYFDTETLISKQFSNDHISVDSEPYSTPVVIPESTVNYRGNPDTRQHNLPSFSRQDDYVPPPPHYRAREQAHVNQSCLCNIL